MRSKELLERGQEYSDFVGVFPLNKLPPHLPHGSGSFIVNSDTHNLPGEHWLAVSYKNGGIVKAFDPLGFFYPLGLVNYLAKRFPRKTIQYNWKSYQKLSEKTCGEHCLRWLDQEH